MNCFSYFTIDHSQQILATLVKSNCAVDFSFCAKITIASCFSEAEPDSTSFLLMAVAAFKSKLPKLQVQADTLKPDLSACREVAWGGEQRRGTWCQGEPGVRMSWAPPTRAAALPAVGARSHQPLRGRVHWASPPGAGPRGVKAGEQAARWQTQARGGGVA